MSSLIALASGLSQWLAPTVGTGVFGLTAGVGLWLTNDREKDRPLLGPDGDVADPSEGIIREGRGRGSDRREAYRRYGTPVRVVVADDQLAEFATGWVVDRSTGGLGVELDMPLPAGSVLNLRPGQVPGMQLWVAGVVRNCRDHLDYWKVGCEFLQPPPWNVLRLFG